MKNIEQSIFSLSQIATLIHNLNKKSEKQFGISLAQWCLLKHLLDMPETSAFALSKTIGVHPSTLTQTLKRLERKGYIFIMDDPNDSRKKLISITRSGKTVMEAAITNMQAWSHDLLKADDALTKINLFLRNRVKLIL